MRHPDVERRAAFDRLSDCLAIARGALGDLLEAAQDLRLTAVATNANSSPLESLSITSLCFILESQAFVAFEDSLLILKRGFSRVRQIRNASPELVPIHRLPRELLSSIFLVGESMDFAAYRPKCTNRPGQLRVPDVVTQVCSIWRDTSVGTHSLWTRIPFCKAQTFDRYHVWLERCRPLPPSLNVHLCHKDPEEMEKMLAILLRSVSQCRALEFHTSPPYMQLLLEFLTVLETMPEQNGPETIIIKICSEVAATKIFDVPLSKFRSTLKTLDLEVHGYGEVPPSWLRNGLRGQNLAILRLRWLNFIDADLLGHILRGCTNLQELILDVGSPMTQPLADHDIKPGYESILMPHLRHFRFTDSFSDMRFRSFLLSIHAPSLDEVELTLYWDQKRFDYALQFLTQSNAPIHQLSFHNLTIWEGPYVEFAGGHILQNFPHLLKLEFHGRWSVSLTSDTLKGLTPDSDGNCACPHLQTLVLVDIYCSPSLLVDLVEARRAHPTTVARLHILTIRCMILPDDSAVSNDELLEMRDRIRVASRPSGWAFVVVGPTWRTVRVS